MALVKAAQLSMNDIAAFKGNVEGDPTDVYWDKKADAPIRHGAIFRGVGKIGSDRPYHYLGQHHHLLKNRRAFGEAMLELRKGK